MSNGPPWRQLLDEAIAEERSAVEATLGRSLNPTELAYAEDRARLKAPDHPLSTGGRFAHGHGVEALGAVAEYRPGPALILTPLSRRRGRAR
jgi:hypothetical protein